MDKKSRILLKLKPKAKQFGFSKKVLKSVAAKIADKLDINDDASEDDINAKIEEAIEDSLPYLALAQSSANEQLEEWKKGLQRDEIEEEEEDVEEGESPEPNRRNRQNKSPKGTSGQSKEMKQLLDAVTLLTNEVKTLKGEKVADSRRAKLEALVKDAGVYGKRILKNFDKMKFENDEEFDEFYAENEADLKVYNQERADAGLSTAGNPPGGKGGSKPGGKIEEVTDAEIDAIVANL